MSNILWTEREKIILKEKYPTSSISNLQTLLPNRAKQSIYEKARSLGIKRKDKGLFNRNGNLEILLNKSLLSHYWIGFIFADGYVEHARGRLTVSLGKKDTYHLQKLASYLNTDIRTIYHPGNPAYKIAAYKLSKISISQPNVIKKFSSIWNINPNKTYNPPSIPILNNLLDTKDKFISFLIGFIDGDGCISTNSKGYSYLIIDNHSSWIEIHNFFITKLKEYNIYFGKSSAKITKRGYSKIQLSGVLYELKQNAQRLSLPIMERKWNLINEQ